MKREYVRPFAMVETFLANEYVAACGDTNKVYKFKCTAGGGKHADVYTESGKNLTNGSLRYFYACNKEHEAPVSDDFINGTIVYNGGNDEAGRYVGIWPFGHYEGYDSESVIIWTEGGNDVHCSTAIDMDSWETAKS